MSAMNEDHSRDEQAQRDNLEELHAQVRGQVQGVGFRYFVIQRAVQLGLRGYVRNASDGSVEVLAQGARPVLERLLTLLWQGPSAAYVQSVETEWRKPAEYLSGFHIRW
ncbi:MAG TPA: acylphosphatase [Ktedonobacteraceae bacterium]|nr:acylphosphatase [Ktedonobacteraceae bacterium]